MYAAWRLSVHEFYEKTPVNNQAKTAASRRRNAEAAFFDRAAARLLDFMPRDCYNLRATVKHGEAESEGYKGI